MNRSRMRLKKSESGAALLLLVSVIGLFFVLTVASFLLLSAVNQDSSRVASAKIDVASREETLMRAVLQQTALGMEPATDGPGSTWTNIMTAAVNEVLATQYVDPAEIKQIFGANAPITVNTGDTGGATLAIFQGYQPPGDQYSEVPNGGTVGVAGLLTAYDPTVQPPELAWAANPNISAATAATNPLQFFLGSQVSATGNPNTSPSGRWGQMQFPNIRFGFMQPGNLMVARRVWWRIPILYQPTNGTVEAPGVLRYPPSPANYIISIYEIPSQLPITGNANIQLGLDAEGNAWGNTSPGANGNVQINGSIYGDLVQLQGGTYSGGISSRNQVNVGQAASVDGQSYTSNNYDDLGVREQADLTLPIGAAPVSVVGDNGKVLLLPILPGQSFFNTAPSVPTAWDLYARPYYHCRIRITVSGTDNNLNYSGGQINTTGNTGAITVTINYLPDVSETPDAMFGVLDPPNAPGWNTNIYQQTSNAGGSGNLGGSGQLVETTGPNPGTNSGFLIYTSTDSGNPSQDRNILEIDLIQLYRNLNLNPAQCYSIYLQCPASQNPNNPSIQNLGIVLTDAADLTGATTGLPKENFSKGFSLVTPQPVYLSGGFNSYPFPGGGPPTSIYASDLRYGIDGAPVQINLTGQISVSQVNETPTNSINPLSFSNAAGNAITGPGNSYKLNAITNPTALPPIMRLNLLFTVEKERPN